MKLWRTAGVSRLVETSTSRLTPAVRLRMQKSNKNTPKGEVRDFANSRYNGAT
jgi:hypothetical protein